MEFRQQALQYCENITALTGVFCTLMDASTGRFFRSPFRTGCTLGGNACTAAVTHKASCREASRWNGKYMYRCPCGFTFIATSLRQPKGAEEYGLITGPFILSDDETAGLEESAQDLNQPQVPYLTTRQAQALNQTVHAVCGYLTAEQPAPNADFNLRLETLDAMRTITQPEERVQYPLEEEHRLQQLIRSGNKKEAQQLLNDLLLELYLAGGTDLLVLKLRIRDLITLMSRAAMDSGADSQEILALCDRSVIEIERMRDFDSLDDWLGLMLHKFFDLAFAFYDVKHQKLIHQIASYIQHHLAEKLTLEQVAREVHLSKSYLCRILKEELGCTFTEYTNRLRIERSKNYLYRSNLSLAEIACAVGFDDQSYFTRIFKRMVGMPPGKYRSSNINVS